jgi:cellulose biosynthesis protein BcsQ
MKTIAFNATKGGAGKSTLSIITLNALTAAGYKCLAIDADMINHSLSFYYNAGIPFETIQAKNIFNTFTGGSIKDNIITINDRLDLLHADVRLSDFRSIESYKRLKKIIHGADGYDYAIIDTAPTFDNITANVFHTSDYLIIPVIPDVFNYQSVKYLFGKLTDLELPALDTTIIFNQYERSRTDNKETFNNQVLDLFRNDTDLKPFIADAVISKSNIIKKYINDRGYRINERHETIKQFNEIKDFIKATLAITLKAGAV